MRIELHGCKPSGPQGQFFLFGKIVQSIAALKFLWFTCHEVLTEDDLNGFFEDGHILSKPGAMNLGVHLSSMLDSGEVAAYARSEQSGSTCVLFSDGSLHRARATDLPGLVADFAQFCRESGGFEVCLGCPTKDGHMEVTHKQQTVGSADSRTNEETFETARTRVIETTKHKRCMDGYWRELVDHALPHDMSHECLDDELRRAFLAKYTDWKRTEGIDGSGWWGFYCEFMANKDWKDQNVRDALTWQDVAGVLSILPL